MTDEKARAVHRTISRSDSPPRLALRPALLDPADRRPGEVVDRLSLADELDAARFVRVHRSAIVNLAFVRELEPLASGDQRLVLSDGTELRVSRTYRAALEERLGRR